MPSTTVTSPWTGDGSAPTMAQAYQGLVLGVYAPTGYQQTSANEYPGSLNALVTAPSGTLTTLASDPAYPPPAPFFMVTPYVVFSGSPGAINMQFGTDLNQPPLGSTMSVYRATSQFGTYTLLASGLALDATNGNVYYEDETSYAGNTYWYYAVNVNLGGGISAPCNSLPCTQT